MEYDGIRELFRGINPKYDMQLQNIFDDHVRNVMKDLQLRMAPEQTEIQANTYILRVEHIFNFILTQAKYALQELCFSQMIDYIA